MKKIREIYKDAQRKVGGLGVSAFAGIAILSSAVAEDKLPKHGDFGNFREQSQAATFLQQAAFGGTQAEINALAARINKIGQIRACEEWIDKQFEIKYVPIIGETNRLIGKTSTSRKSPNAVYSDNSSYHSYKHAFINNTLRTPSPLKSRWAFEAHQIWVTSGSYWQTLYRARYKRQVAFYDRLGALIDNNNANFKSVIQACTSDTFMQSWLTNISNAKANAAAGTTPDENYARELLQLFSIGIYVLDNEGNYQYDANGNIVENYGGDEVQEFAQAFTGFGYGDRRWGFNSGTQTLRMGTNVKYYDSQHDRSTKILLNGAVLPAKQKTSVDVRMALNNIYGHPSFAPYISIGLIKRYTKSNPSPAYVARVTKVWDNTNGNIRSVLKAILLDPEVRNASSFARDRQSIARLTPKDRLLGGKLKNKLVRRAAFMRFFEPTYTLAHYASNNKTLDNNFHDSPTVFNYYNHNHEPASGPIADERNKFSANNGGAILVTEFPELETFDEDVVNDYEFFYNQIAKKMFQDRSPGERTGYNLTNRLNLNNTRSVLKVLDRYLCGGKLDYNLQARIAAKYPTMNTVGSFAQVLTLVYTSPAYQTYN